jgi:polysaccharide biosynthesis PFTS motif protein
MQERLNFIRLFFLLSVKVFLELILGRTAPALMMRELVLFIRAFTASADQFFGAYYFHSSDYIYKPLWLDIAELNGSEIYVYFYSANIEPPLPDHLDVAEFSLLTWPNYLVWNLNHHNFLAKKIIRKSNITEEGPIFFSDDALKEIPQIHSHKKTIAIFDITPFRKSRHATLGSYNELYTFKPIKKFYIDLINLAKLRGYQIILKPKRQFSTLHHKGYINFLNEICKEDNIYIADGNINAERIIKISNVVISYPFTSTSLIAHHIGIPSIYYFPSNELPLESTISKEIPLIQSYQNLEHWFCNFESGANQ